MTEVYTIEDQRFRLAARIALEESALEVGWTASTALGNGDEVERERRRMLDRLLFAKGWMGLAWPVQYGGGGRSQREYAILAEEASRLGLSTWYNRIALGIVGPALLMFGSEAQKERFLRPALACDEIWCQGFSEPNAGSDLASLRTRAVVDGHEWRISGQKIWTTLGNEADYCFLLARTGSQPRHRGLTVLLVPMHQTGIEVRTIKQMNGEEEFCEVWFDEARAPRDAVLGEIDGGWTVTMSALTYERSLYLLQRQLRLRRLTDELIEGVDWLNADDAVKDALIDADIASTSLGLCMRDQIERLDRGEPVGVYGNASKVYWSESYQKLTRLAVDLAMAGLAPGREAWVKEHYSSLATSIYAGTNEIQRNIISEQALGMPR
jgi:alkylation response protein AidB-like acyl-CoA dehydrogenase